MILYASKHGWFRKQLAAIKLPINTFLQQKAHDATTD
jgi:hypothetical protein